MEKPIASTVRELLNGLKLASIWSAPQARHMVQENLARSRMERAGVVLTTTNTLIAEIVQDWSTPQGSELIQLLIATVPKTPRID